jgi:PIN domain nuclease of toxin-antitoxin system
MKYVLDTHILVWWTLDRSRLSRRQQTIVDALSEESPAYVSEISLWEIATAYSLGRIELFIPLREYLDAAVALPLVQRVSISPEIATEVASLPDTFHRDPGDRIIVSTARILGATLVTSDDRIRSSRLVKTVG